MSQLEMYFPIIVTTSENHSPSQWHGRTSPAHTAMLYGPLEGQKGLQTMQHYTRWAFADQLTPEEYQWKHESYFPHNL